MPRAKTKLEYSTFVKGLITEASPLTYPDNASLVDENFVLNRDGSRQRRLGMKYEPNYVFKSIPKVEGTTQAINSYTWKSVNNDGTVDLAVIQIGGRLYFFDNNVSPITNAPKNGGNYLTLSTNTNIKFEFTESYGRLIVVTGDDHLSIVEYNSILDSLTVLHYHLFVRDVFGVADDIGLGVTDHPTILSDIHEYNLRNQGWRLDFTCSTNSSGGGVTSPYTNTIEYTKTILGYYPSNAETLGSAVMGAASNIAAINSYSPWDLTKTNLGSTQAPRGRYPINIFNRGNSRRIKTGITTLLDDQTLGGITAISSYSGRVFFAVTPTGTIGTDDNSPNIGSMIFFNKSSNNLDEIGQCYSLNDPTALEFNDPVDTDGGFIKIPDIGNIYKLSTLGKSLYVFSSKGIWEINGGDTYFSSTNQVISKITNFGPYSANSVVPGETMIGFWSAGGIYGLTLDPVSGFAVVQNITQNTIQGLFDDIDSVAKENVAATYDDISKQFRWLYREGILPNVQYFNRELIFDLNLQAFYINKIGELTVSTGTAPYIVGYVDVSAAIFTNNIESVIADINGQVLVSGEDVQVTLRESDQTTKGSTKYWAIKHNSGSTSNLVVAGYYDLNWTDWPDVFTSTGAYGKDAQAILLTGHTTFKAAEASKRIPIITLYLKRTESGFTDDGLGNLTPIGASSCKLQAQWEWTNDVAAGRWSDEREAYRLPRLYLPTGSGDPFPFGYTVVKTKNRLRGKGSSVSLLFKSSPLKDLHIYGWSFDITTEAA